MLAFWKEVEAKKPSLFDSAGIARLYNVYMQHSEKKDYERGKKADVNWGVELEPKTTTKNAGQLQFILSRQWKSLMEMKLTCSPLRLFSSS